MPDLPRLKLACKASIKAAGGLEAVAIDLGKSFQQVSNHGNPNVAGNWMTLPEAATVEEIGGEPALARYFARLTGHEVFRLPPVPDGPGQMFESLTAASAEFGDVATSLLDATRDGKFCAADRRDVTVQIDEAVQSLLAMRAIVNAG